MTDAATPQDEDFDSLDRLHDAFHANARKKGFVDLHDRLAQLAAHVRVTDPDLADYMLQCEAGNELMLIVTELGEAHEEIRTSPFAMHETYYVDENGEKTLYSLNDDGTPRKPEGLASELADVEIRLGDTARRRRISVAESAREKAFYNSTRAMKHGGKRF
jgi:hypothetical protein